MKGGNDYRNLAISSKEFVKLNGNIILKPGTLAPIGNELYQAYLNLNVVLTNIVHKEPDNSDYVKIWNAANKICDVFQKYSGNFDDIDFDAYKD